MGKRSTTTKNVALLHQLLQDGQLRVAPEFQRNAVWPPAAKAYLIDTILNERPMPLFFLQRGRSAQTGKPLFAVVDGQQRLRSIFEYIEDRFPLNQSKDRKLAGKRFSQLTTDQQNSILDYDLNVEELSGYSEDEVRDIFVRMNKYVVKLSPQELRHAKEAGAFYDFVEELARIPFWHEQGVFSKALLNRMKASEFSAELVILLVEGPQDKKSSVDLYYGTYQARFPDAKEVHARLLTHLKWITTAIPNLSKSRYRKPVDLYSLIAALNEIAADGRRRKAIGPQEAGRRLIEFERELKSTRPTRRATKYLVAASRQTDNIGPRATRIEVVKAVLLGKDA